MNKKEIRLKQWAKKKIKEGFTKNQIKYVFKRKGIREEEAEKIISSLHKKPLIIVILLISVSLLVLSLYIFHFSDEKNNLQKEVTFKSLLFNNLSFAGFDKMNTTEGLIFVRIEKDAAPTLITINIARKMPEEYIKNFLKRNIQSYKSFKPISRWATNNTLGNDYSYTSAGKEYIVSQRILRFNGTIIDISIRVEKKNYNKSKEIIEKGVRKIERLLKTLSQ